MATDGTHEVNTVIEIRVQADVVEARNRVWALAKVVSFSPFERSLIAAATSEVARMILNSPGHGAIALAVVKHDEAPAIAVGARFRNQTSDNLDSRNRANQRRPAGRGIRDVGGIFDSLDMAQQDGDLVVTLVKSNRLTMEQATG